MKENLELRKLALQKRLEESLGLPTNATERKLEALRIPIKLHSQFTMLGHRMEIVQHWPKDDAIQDSCDAFKLMCQCCTRPFGLHLYLVEDDLRMLLISGTMTEGWR